MCEPSGPPYIRDCEVLRVLVTHQCGRILAGRVFWLFGQLGLPRRELPRWANSHKTLPARLMWPGFKSDIDASSPLLWEVFLRISLSFKNQHFYIPVYLYTILHNGFPSQCAQKTGLQYHRDEIHQLQRSWLKSNASWNVRKRLSEFLRIPQCFVSKQIIKQVTFTADINKRDMNL